MKNLILLILALISFITMSAPISFNWLKSESDHYSALSGHCDYVSSSTSLKCNLRQIGARKKVSKDEYLQKITEVKEEVNKQLKQISANEYVQKEVPELNQLCELLPSQKNAIDESHYNKIMAVCKAPSKDNIIALFSHSAEQGLNTCMIAERDIGTFIFDKVSDNKWVSTNKPSGDCGVVTVMTLENREEYNLLWSFTQNRHYTVTDSKLCKDLSEVNEPISFSWNGQDNIKMDCEYIEFGF